MNRRGFLKACGIGAAAVVVPALLTLIASIISLISPFTMLLGTIYLIRAVWIDTFKHGGVLNKSLDEFTDALGKWADDTLGIFDEIFGFFWGIAKLLGTLPKSLDNLMRMGRPDKGEYPWLDMQFEERAIPPFSLVVKKGAEAAKAIGTIAKEQLEADLKAMEKTIMTILPEGWAKGFDGVLDEIRNFVRAFMTENPFAEIGKQFDKSVEGWKKTARDWRKTAIEYGLGEYAIIPLLPVKLEPYQKDPYYGMSRMHAHWKEAQRKFFRPPTSAIENWQDKFVAALTSVESSWTSTFENMMSTGSNFKDLMEDMFLGILNAFRRMVAEIAAKNLMAALTGQELAPGVPSWRNAWKWLTGRDVTGYEGAIPYEGIQQRWTPNPMDYYPDISGSSAQKPVPGGGNVIINFENKTGTDASLSASKPAFNGKDWVVSVVMEAYRTDPNVRDALKR